MEKLPMLEEAFHQAQRLGYSLALNQVTGILGRAAEDAINSENRDALNAIAYCLNELRQVAELDFPKLNDIEAIK